jgi:GAF domain-containing protein
MNPIDPLTASKLADALASGPTALFAVLSELFTSVPGIRTATFIATAPDKTVTHRIGTSNPVDFPIGNVDPINDSLWNRSMLADQQPLIGDDTPGMVHFLGDEAAGLVAMGYTACSCFPIVIAGETRGVVALLGNAGIFTPAALAQINALLPIAALTFTFEGISER